MAAMQLVLSVAVFLACRAAGQRPIRITGPNLGTYDSPLQCPNPCAPVPYADLPCMLDPWGCTRKPNGIRPERPDLTGSCIDYRPGGEYPRFFDRLGCTGNNPLVDLAVCEYLGWFRFRNGALYPEAMDPEGKTAACRSSGPGFVYYHTVNGTYYPNDIIVPIGSSGQGTSGLSPGGAASTLTGGAGALEGAASGLTGGAAALNGAASTLTGGAGALNGAASGLTGGAAALNGATPSLTGGAGGPGGATSNLPTGTGGPGGVTSNLPTGTGVPSLG